MCCNQTATRVPPTADSNSRGCTHSISNSSYWPDHGSHLHRQSTWMSLRRALGSDRRVSCRLRLSSSLGFHTIWVRPGGAVPCRWIFTRHFLEVLIFDTWFHPRFLWIYSVVGSGHWNHVRFILFSHQFFW